MCLEKVPAIRAVTAPAFLTHRSGVWIAAAAPGRPHAHEPHARAAHAAGHERRPVSGAGGVHRRPGPHFGKGPVRGDVGAARQVRYALQRARLDEQAPQSRLCCRRHTIGLLSGSPSSLKPRMLMLHQAGAQMRALRFLLASCYTTHRPCSLMQRMIAPYRVGSMRAA